MKSAKLYGFLLVTSWIGLSRIHAQTFTGSDNFDGPSKDTTKWGAAAGSSASTSIIQANGQIYYSVAGTPLASADDIVVWPWKTNAPVNLDWTAQFEVNVPITFTPLGTYNGFGQGFGFGLAVSKNGSAANYFSCDLLTSYVSSATTAHQFSSEYVTNGVSSMNRIATISTHAVVRIRWSASSKTLFAEYDADGPIGGFQWSLLRSIVNPWNMSGSDTFLIYLLGFSHGLNISPSHNVFGDNFVVAKGTNSPEAVVIGPAVELKWASFPGRMQQLQVSTNLTNWRNFGPPSIGDGMTNRIYQSSQDANKKFYRIWFP